MRKVDFDLDERMSHLELEWRQAAEASLAARATFESILGTPQVAVKVIQQAREKMERAEALKQRVMVKIDQLENAMIGGA